VLRALKVASSSGAPVPLRLVADIEIGSGEGSIDRFDRERRVAVEADLVGGATLGQALAAVQALPGYTIPEQQDQNDVDQEQARSHGQGELAEGLGHAFRIAVEADLVGGATLGQALAAVQALPGYTNLPTGVRMLPSPEPISISATRRNGTGAPEELATFKARSTSRPRATSTRASPSSRQGPARCRSGSG
jgi:multidrug efflux pump subunit AcrB